MASDSMKEAAFRARRRSTFLSDNYRNMQGFTVRRLYLHDVPLLKRLVNKTTQQLFGDIDLYDIVYGANLTMGLQEPGGRIVAAVCMNDHPNIMSVPEYVWGRWVRNLFGLDALNQIVTMWIHLLLFLEVYEMVFLKPILEVLFKGNKNLNYLALVVPPGVKQIKFLTEFVVRVLPIGYVNPTNVTTIALMARQHFLTKYKIRRAVEEDNDDIIPLIHSHSTRLCEMYGEFYIAELLTRIEDSERQIIVAEYNGLAVAVLIMNKNVNYDVLNENFELTPYHGLKTPHPQDEIYYTMISEIEIEKTQKDDVSVLSGSMFDNYEDEVHDQSVKSDDWSFEFSLEEAFEAFEAKTEEVSRSESLFTSVMLNYPENESDQCHVDIVDRKISKPELETAALAPQFFGKKNAFALEVAVSHEDHNHAMEFLLQSAFECFPDREYCVLCLPAEDPPVYIVRDFVKIPPRYKAAHPQELYLLHRNAVESRMFVRMALISDKPFVEQFLKNMLKPGNVLEHFVLAASDLDSISMAFVMMNDNQLVGVGIINENVDLDYIYAHYALYHWLNQSKHTVGSVGVLEHFLIYPIFQQYCQFFLNQMHRLSQCTALFYTIGDVDQEEYEKEKALVNCLQSMIPILLRPNQEYDPNIIEGDCVPMKPTVSIENTFALFLSMTRLSSIPRIEVNTRIVVVGSGDTAAAFLDTLVRTSIPEVLVTFTNVVVVSPHGLSDQKPYSKISQMFNITRGRYTIRQAALRTYLNYVKGVMTDINRKKKHIIVNHQTSLPYDRLVILCGTQYQYPEIPEKKNEKVEILSNIIVINTETDSAKALYKVKALLHSENGDRSNGKVIVYGHRLRSHCCLAALLEFGVPAKRLVFVDPVVRTMNEKNATSLEPLIYTDPEVEIAVMNNIRELGIKVYQPYFLLDWTVDYDTNRVTSVKFESKCHLLELSCKCMFVFDRKSISAKTFGAIINSSLVYDGHLVIDSKCRTNDPSIYAAGPITKYSRKYYADHMSHVYYNSYEVGEKLALDFRQDLIPQHFGQSEEISKLPVKLEKKKCLIPVYTQPLVVCCTLPGRIHFLHIERAGPSASVENILGKENYGQVLITGELADLDRQGYFRIHINKNDFVETITCLSKTPLDVNNLINVWGRHVKLLNNLLVRFEMMMITDLFKFFKEPWSCGIYYDRFPELMKHLDKLFLETGETEEDFLINKIHKFYEENKWGNLNLEQEEEIKAAFNANNSLQQIEQDVLGYVQENVQHLSMYAYPSLIRMLLQNYMRSPLFSK